MVKADGVGPFQIVAVADGIAELLTIDDFGRVRIAYIETKALRTMRDVFNPRSCWPEIRLIDEIGIIEEERRACAERKAKAKKAKKPKTSKKLKRKAA